MIVPHYSWIDLTRQWLWYPPLILKAQEHVDNNTLGSSPTFTLIGPITADHIIDTIQVNIKPTEIIQMTPPMPFCSVFQTTLLY